MTTTNYVNLANSKFISISGEDTKEFLQGIITNDINQCDKNSPIYSCLLTPQGKFLADFFIIYQEKNYLIEIHEKHIEEFLKKIKIYILRSKIQIKNITNLASILIFNKCYSWNFDDDIIHFHDPRNNNIGTKIIIDKDKLNKFTNSFNLNEINFSYYRELLLKFLIPFSPEDLKINKSLLLENNFEKINAINWDKGCYVGQEITARMKYRSLLKKSIRSLEIISGKVNIENKIYYNEKVIGEIISYFNNYSIGMLKIVEANEVFNNENILKTESAELKIIN